MNPATYKVPLRILLSYHYFKQFDMTAKLDEWFPHQRPEVFADSGAFSALTKGAPITVPEYGAWIREWEHLFTTYVNLDVIGNDEHSAEATWENQQALEAEGLSPLPVVHFMEPWTALDRLLEHGYRYIGLGGLVGRPARLIMPWLVDVFRRTHGDAVFHLFGVTNWTVMASLPFYSADSTSWGAGPRFGELRLFNPKRARWEKYLLNDHRSVYKADAARLIRYYGFDPKLFSDRGTYERARTCQIGAKSWQEAEGYVRHRFGPIRIPGSDSRSPAGLRVYLAETATDSLRGLGQLKGAA